jgi:RNA-binding protein YhbY
MPSGKTKRFDLDRDSTAVCRLSEDAKTLVIEIQTGKEGLTKTGVNSLIDALKKMRDKMVR